MHFSVLMSLYDKEKSTYLEECLESLANQTLPADEIVLVYDGPINADLIAVVEKWSSSLPIKIVALKENVGLGQALNEGMKHCTYNYIARMDTDDICQPNRFELQSRFMDMNPDIDISGSRIREFVDNKDNIVSERIVPLTNDEIARFARLKNPFNHMTVVFKKSSVQSVGGYQHHYLMEDYNLWLRLLGNGFKAGNLDVPLVLVRVGVDMLVRRRGLKYVFSEYKLAQIKRTTGFQNILTASYFFILRSIPRLLPLWVLMKIYNVTRK
ncbi:glycosyltransferase [Enterobacter asburiae]|uniref:glycosyltransferase family 2 protein n=1 Tax=Scandinavium sp. UTDF21-P1B TaxID=3446379 RepID=UPI00349A9F5B